MDKIACGGLFQVYGNVNCTVWEEVVFRSPFCLELAFPRAKWSNQSFNTAYGSTKASIFSTCRSPFSSEVALMVTNIVERKSVMNLPEEQRQ